jgi:hypothetical protein
MKLFYRRMLGLFGLGFFGRGVYIVAFESDWSSSIPLIALGIILIIEYHDRKQN